MSATRRTHVSHFNVEFGDCDPAGIVYFPNFFRWVDAAGRKFFIACGVPSWQDTEVSHGIIGTPIVNTESRFIRPATYGDELAIESSVTEWRGKAFHFQHVIRCRGHDLVEVNEVRVFAKRVDGDRSRIAAVPIPPEFRALCEWAPDGAPDAEGGADSSTTEAPAAS